MKICICCSLTFTDEALQLSKELEELGHEVWLPDGVTLNLINKADFDPVSDKSKNDAIRKHVDKIREADSVLICNYTKNGVENYIGANSFFEMLAAHCLNKRIFTLNPLPDMPYINDEIRSVEAICLDGDLKKIK